MSATVATPTAAAAEAVAAANVTLRVEPVFQLGPEAFKVHMSMHALNRRRLAETVRKSVPARTVMLFAGGNQLCRHETDHEELFRQESNFQWLFGVKEPDCMGVVDVDSGHAVLFVPRLPESYSVWMGEIMPPSYFQALYGVEDCRYVDELPAFLAAQTPARVCTIRGVNTDSGSEAKPARCAGMDAFAQDEATLWPAITNLRAVKTADEIALMRSVNRVASAAHVACMRAVRPGMAEYQLESLFLHESYSKGGHRHAAYTCICGAGINSSVLHYGHAGAPNSRVLQDGDMCLMDMGGEYHCYGADITCSYPANGKFSEKQRNIYGAVLAAMRAVEAAIAPGVRWLDLHYLANREILAGLIRFGLLTGTVDEMMAVHMGAVFMPHGLGHLLGIDTHDVGGYPEGTARINEPGVRSLRCMRTLEEGIVITVEPGLYFIRSLLEKAVKDPSQAKFINLAVLDEYRDCGGVRLESNVVVTAAGCELLTNVPREIADVEAVMAGAEWK
eukprot:c15242_g1_i1.p2 GENE.c15242_g1_i1~~c15242_g1_i1.p2  ORF type:complete len:504 (+),score=99.56 c15242_g1_i1:1164-2675(+)